MGISTSTGTLIAGQSRTFNLSPASAVTLTLSPNVRVTITETPATVAATGLGGNASRVHEPRLLGTFTYGPYPMGGTVVVEVASNSGSSVAWVYTSAAYATDSSGNVTGLVGPDGATIGYVLSLASTAAAVSVTGTTTKTALRTIAIPDGAMGANSRLIIKPIWGYTNSANNKVLTVDVGTSLGGATNIYTRTRTTTAAEMPLIEIANRNDVNAQLIGYAQTGTYTTAQAVANSTATIAFGTSGMNIYVSGTLANTGETITLDSLQVDIVNPYQ